jgi:fatty acid desaturase
VPGDPNHNSSRRESNLPEPVPPVDHETQASRAAQLRSRREAWRAGIFVVVTMLLMMLILLGGALWLIHRK